MKRSDLTFLSVAFFYSGFASLIYEVVWVRMLVFIFGNTAQSITIVIAAFMAGLSAGSYIFGRFTKSTTTLIRLYCMIEICIGMLGLMSPLFIQGSKYIFSQNAGFFYQNSEWELGIKLIISFFILFPAAFFMGGTLPVLIKYCIQRFGNVSKQTGKLYGMNTLGAVFGVLTTGFIFIESVGLFGSLMIAVTCNIVIAVLVFLKIPELTSSQQASSSTIKTKPPRSFANYGHRQTTFLIAIYAISGFISISYEVLWTRLIAPAAGVYVYGFILMLALFLLGLALGSLIYERYLTEIKSSFTLLSILQIGVGFFSLLIVIFAATVMPIWTKYIYRMVVPIIVFLPPTVLMGIMFPAITKTFERNTHVTAQIGKLYALNAIGSILGSIAAGFLLIPLLGTVQSILILAGFSVGLGLILYHLETAPFLPIVRNGGVVILLILLFGLTQTNGLLLPRLYKVHISDIRKRFPQTKTVIKEDSIASILALSFEREPKNVGALYIDGMATTGLVEETKVMAHLPLAIHENPRDVLIIAFGMGTTFRSVLSYPNVQATVVELVPTVPKLMPFFHKDAEEVLSNPQGNVIINDGRNYVSTTKNMYDVITIDPPPPTNGAGTTVLFSKEFYQDVRKILKPHGLVQMWIHFDLDQESTRMFLNTFAHGFPFVDIYYDGQGKGFYLIGSNEQKQINPARINQILQIESVYKDMTEWSSFPFTLDRIQKMYIGDKKKLLQFTQNAPIITDYFPRTEYSFLRTAFNPQPRIKDADIRKAFNLP